MTKNKTISKLDNVCLVVFAFSVSCENSETAFNVVKILQVTVGIVVSWKREAIFRAICHGQRIFNKLTTFLLKQSQLTI